MLITGRKTSLGLRRRSENGTRTEYLAIQIHYPRSREAGYRALQPRNEFRKWDIRLLEIPELFRVRVYSVYLPGVSRPVQNLRSLWPMDQLKPK